MWLGNLRPIANRPAGSAHTAQGSPALFAACRYAGQAILLASAFQAPFSDQCRILTTPRASIFKFIAPVSKFHIRGPRAPAISCGTVRFNAPVRLDFYRRQPVANLNCRKCTKSRLWWVNCFLRGKLAKVLSRKDRTTNATKSIPPLFCRMPECHHNYKSYGAIDYFGRYNRNGYRSKRGRGAERQCNSHSMLIPMPRTVLPPVSRALIVSPSCLRVSTT